MANKSSVQSEQVKCVKLLLQMSHSIIISIINFDLGIGMGLYSIIELTY